MLVGVVIVFVRFVVSSECPRPRPALKSFLPLSVSSLVSALLSRIPKAHDTRPFIKSVGVQCGVVTLRKNVILVIPSYHYGNKKSQNENDSPTSSSSSSSSSFALCRSRYFYLSGILQLLVSCRMLTTASVFFIVYAQR